MARARNIKPGFFMNDKLGELDPVIRLLFVGLWTIADKEGRLEDRPRRIHASCLPYDQVNVDSCLDQLWNKGFIHRYSVGEKRFIEIVNWKRHQNPHHKEADSEIPKYQEDIHACAKHDPSIPDKPQTNPADSGFLIPDSGFLIPDTGFSDSSPSPSPSGTTKGSRAPTSRRSPPATTPRAAKSAETWNAYAAAYFDRYGVEPVRNAKVNAQLSQLVDRLGAEDAPAVAAWYVSHNAQWYVTRGHSVDALLADSEKLRTEWATGRRVTQTAARQADRKQSNLSIAEQLIAESRAKEALDGQ